MIENLIFDMGQVLLRWDPAYIASHYVDDPADVPAFVDALIVQPDWHLADAGQIAEADYRAQLSQRAPAPWRQALLRCYDEFEVHMPPIQAMHALANQAKAAGYGVYVLSNALPRFEAVVRNCPTLQCVDDVVISALVKLAKPDPRIYQLALAQFGVSGDRCVFIDDLAQNVAGAEQAGIHGLRFDGNVPALRESLRQMGVHL